MADPVIDYYLSPQSPWMYLGHARFCELAARHRVDVRVKPVDFARIFSVSGGLPLGQRAAQRQAYRLVELRRFSEHLKIPLNLHPKFFPVAVDAATRLILATQDAHGTASGLALVGGVATALWAEDKNIAAPETLAEILGKLGLNAPVLLAASAEAKYQTQYESLTEEAIGRQVFGAPTYVYRNELFWGQDRLDYLARALGSSPS